MWTTMLCGLGMQQCTNSLHPWCVCGLGMPLNTIKHTYATMHNATIQKTTINVGVCAGHCTRTQQRHIPANIEIGLWWCVGRSFWVSLSCMVQSRVHCCDSKQIRSSTNTFAWSLCQIYWDCLALKRVRHGSIRPGHNSCQLKHGEKT